MVHKGASFTRTQVGYEYHLEYWSLLNQVNAYPTFLAKVAKQEQVVQSLTFFILKNIGMLLVNDHAFDAVVPGREDIKLCNRNINHFKLCTFCGLMF